MPSKPKSNERGERIEGVPIKDLCFTPNDATDMIVPFLRRDWVIWQPFAGEGHMTRRLREHGFTVVSSELRTQGVEADYTGKDYLAWEPPHWDVVIDNPPGSAKYECIARALQLGRPWAFLVPLDTLGAAKMHQPFLEAHRATGYGPEVYWPQRRVNYRMPNRGWSDETGWKSSAQFYSIWLSWRVTGLMLPVAAFEAMAQAGQPTARRRAA